MPERHPLDSTRTAEASDPDSLTASRALGDVDPARSRHAGRRSTVALTDDLVVAGTADGRLLAFGWATDASPIPDAGTGSSPAAVSRPLAIDDGWQFQPADRTPPVVAATAYDGGIVVGERSEAGQIRCHDPESGAVRWRQDTSADLGPPQRDTRFFLPFVVDLASTGDRAYALARRYARDGDERSFTSVLYAFDDDGDVQWQYETDASAIAIDVDAEPAQAVEPGIDADAELPEPGTDARTDATAGRVAVAYNRCTGDHQQGLVVLDAATGDPLYDWDPGTGGQRRVGDVSLVDDGVVLTSHGDYRGYRLADGGAERWRVDLATPLERGDETLYAFPNHVQATDAGVVFVTGNTYAVDARETDGLHPDEHTAFGYDHDGERRWTERVGGFATQIAVVDDTVAVPGAQHFRTRDSDVHGLDLFDVGDGQLGRLETPGIVTAVDAAATEASGGDVPGSADGDGDAVIAAIEEPVVYHDEGTERGSYRLHCLRATDLE